MGNFGGTPGIIIPPTDVSYKNKNRNNVQISYSSREIPSGAFESNTFKPKDKAYFRLKQIWNNFSF